MGRMKVVTLDTMMEFMFGLQMVWNWSSVISLESCRDDLLACVMMHTLMEMMMVLLEIVMT